MPAMLHALQTVVPPTVITQPDVRDLLAGQPGRTRMAQRLIRTAFDASGIDQRHTVIAEFGGAVAGDAPVFLDPETRLLQHPGTKVRSDVYAQEASALYVEAARRAVAAASGMRETDITHVITVSCTGFYAPGPDFEIARDLGLRANVQRYHLGFMGCYAALPALRMAAQFCAADPDAVVLVVCAELCTLHVHASDDPDTIVASSLFADGAAAALVSNQPPSPGQIALALDAFDTVVTPVGEKEMTWSVGDYGFDMVLSRYVPHIIGEHIGAALRPLLQREFALSADDDVERLSHQLSHWAIHPGGRDILDRVQSRLCLSEAQMTPARETLREYGNMSSVTVLFVLERIFADATARDGDRVAAMAFGPGLTVESGLFTLVRGEDRAS